jgi:hypothetical protein
MYSLINDLKQSLIGCDAKANEKEIYRIDAIIQGFLHSFPVKSRYCSSTDGDQLLDTTTLSLAHW